MKERTSSRTAPVATISRPDGYAGAPLESCTHSPRYVILPSFRKRAHLCKHNSGQKGENPPSRVLEEQLERRASVHRRAPRQTRLYDEERTSFVSSRLADINRRKRQSRRHRYCRLTNPVPEQTQHAYLVRLRRAAALHIRVELRTEGRKLDDPMSAFDRASSGLSSSMR